METRFMQNFGGKTKSIMVFLKVAYIQHVSNTVQQMFQGHCLKTKIWLHMVHNSWDGELAIDIW